MSRAILLLISGPAGSGKTTLCSRLMEAYPSVRRVVTATTRNPRPGEEDGVDYHFLTPEAFKAGIANDEFYEHALVHCRHYGVLKREIDGKLDAGQDLLLNVDVQGAASFRKAAAESPTLAERLTTVFVELSFDQIRERLLGRGTDDEAEITRRMKSAEIELKEAPHFQHRIQSQDKDADYAALRDIYLGAKGT